MELWEVVLIIIAARSLWYMKKRFEAQRPKVRAAASQPTVQPSQRQREHATPAAEFDSSLGLGTSHVGLSPLQSNL